jgi:hypothetical protein
MVHIIIKGRIARNNLPFHDSVPHDFVFKSKRAMFVPLPKQPKNAWQLLHL